MYTLPAAALDLLVHHREPEPHRLLGVHSVPDTDRLQVRALWPDAEALWLCTADALPLAMTRLHACGLFAVEVDATAQLGPGSYAFERRPAAGPPQRRSDPYAFDISLGPLDVHLFGEGKHRGLARHFGGRLCVHQEVPGAAFAVWAPTCQRVSLVGEFNDWDGRAHPLRRLDGGVWELFVPGLGEGDVYKYEIVGASGQAQLKADPLGRAMELRPQTASILAADNHRWNDAEWMAKRGSRDPAGEPMSIYEVHLGSWRHEPSKATADQPGWLNYRELADQLVEYVVEQGFTHVELLPIMEHPLDKSWGYQVGGYYAPTARHGDPDDFRYFVDRCHQRGIGVLLDWVPAHFPKDAFALGRFDGSAVYEHLDPRQGEHRQWGTYIFNYGRNEVRNFLIANALYWLSEFHVDGLRADAVASMLYLDYGANDPGAWLPNRFGGHENLDAVEFLRELNNAVDERHPGCVVIAEESTSWPGVTHAAAAGGLGFDLKWNMGWMHDTLEYFSKDPIHRSFHHNLLTFGLMYAFSERFVLPLSHDEVVHLKKSLLSKMAGDRWQMFANLRALYGHMWAHPGKKLLFMGGEFGQWSEWSESQSLPWELLEDPQHAGLQQLVRDLNRAYAADPTLFRLDQHSDGFRWIDANDNLQSVISYLRFAEPASHAPDASLEARDYLICVGNFTPEPRYGYRIGVPRAAPHREALNTDAACYGGSNVGNLGAVPIEAVPAHGYAQSLQLTLPPLAVLWLKPETIP